MVEYIERDAALNFEVDSVLLAPGALQPFMDGMAFYADHIKRIPAADVAPVRHGRFLGTEYDGYADGNPVYYEWQCSECGCLFEDDEPTYNYCPNCGALMDKDGDGDV